MNFIPLAPSKRIKVDEWDYFQNNDFFLNIKLSSEVVPGLLVIQIQIQVVCPMNSMQASKVKLG